MKPMRSLLVAAMLWMGVVISAAALSWYDAAGALATGINPAGATDSGRNGGGNTPDGGGGSLRRKHQHTEDVSAREDAVKLRETMHAVVAEYDKIGAGELARQCIDASRIVQIAENPTGGREVLFLLAGLVSLVAAMFITKLLASMFKVEIAQLLWIPIAGGIAVLAGLFAAIQVAKKRKAVLAAGVVLSTAGVISLVGPVRHAFFGIVADVFVVFTACYVPLAATALGIAGLLFVFSLLCKNFGDGFGSIGEFLLRNTIGLVAIPGVCAFLFLAILSVVGPWFEGHAGDFASSWASERLQRRTELAGGSASLESPGLSIFEADRETRMSSSRFQGHSGERETETANWSGKGGSVRFGAGFPGQFPGGDSFQAATGYSRSGHDGEMPFSAYPKAVRRTAAEIARAAEAVHEGRLPRGAKPFGAFRENAALASVSAHEWDRARATFSTQAGLVAQVYRRRTGWGKRETVVMFRGAAGTKDGVEDWRRTIGHGDARQCSEAAALLRAVKETTDDPVVVAGHSTGGGQALRALAANAEAGGIRGMGFNTTGLSRTSGQRMGGGQKAADGTFATVRLDGDPVSAAEILPGRVILVPSAGVRGWAAHSIAVLAREMERNAT